MSCKGQNFSLYYQNTKKEFEDKFEASKKGLGKFFKVYIFISLCV